MVVPLPPEPFHPESHTLDAGVRLYRVLQAGRRPAEFNPGFGSQRFSFFGDPPVPVLYGAQSETAAVCETLLHNVPASGGAIEHRMYARRVAVQLVVQRRLTLASFMGTGLRRLGVEAKDLTDTEADSYGETVKWARAAHRAGYDGLVWMSRRCNSDRAYAFFGGNTGEDDFKRSADYGRVFASGPDLDWLTDFCSRFRIELLESS